MEYPFIHKLLLIYLRKAINEKPVKLNSFFSLIDYELGQI